jgi:hypothetical protein
MSATTRYGDVLRLLIFRDKFHDFELALTMVGFAPDPDDTGLPARPAVPMPEPPDEDEQVFAEPVDGWLPSGNERWSAEGRAQAGPGDGVADDTAVEHVELVESAEHVELVEEAEEVEAYGANWQPIRPLPSPGSGPGPASVRWKTDGPRPFIRSVIAHVLPPTSTGERSPRTFTYRPVPRRERSQSAFDWPRQPNEAAWRLAVECLSATSLRPRRQSIDVAACVDALARLETIERLPMRERGVRLATADTLLCDIALANGPVGEDVAAFTASILANSRHGVDVLGFNQTVDYLGCGKGPIWSWRPLDMAMLGERVIAVSSIPPGSLRRSEVWRRFAQSINDSGRSFAFVNAGEPGIAVTADWPGSWFTLAC